MRIGILGTGTMATALGEAWVRTGHEVAVGGRSHAKGLALAERLGDAARAVTPREAVTGRDAVLLAVPWRGVEDILGNAGAADGVLGGTPLIDCTNAVEHGIGVLLPENGESAAQRIASMAPGAHVVKAFHLFPAEQWMTPPTPSEPTPTVAICGDESTALQTTSQLVRDTGAEPAVLGPLTRARQLEEVAGFVIGLTFAGVDPNSTIPRATSPLPAAIRG